MPEKYKLTYFNLKGLAESIRFVFAYAGQEYEDVRISRADWPTIKESYPNHKLPVLEVDGKMLNQSVAIARYIGKQFNLVTEDPFREAQLEAVLDDIKDLQDKMRQAFVQKTPEAQKEREDATKFLLERIEKVAVNGYLYGSKATWIDIFFAGYSEAMDSFFPGFLEPYPNLTTLAENIKNNEGVKAYIAKRPEPEPIS